ncbi:hypothetical protein BC793_101247 [Actinoplanes xinjiangensis]|uniref:Uncharacterized protein n=1 Tax=Actinoplanes xinjiangensis TaxID=512350 RepID=A0A316FUH5_9ACTN|nr:hypothetical protein BC793_101247 [Actinoplanes xinjiangensis]
MHWAPARSRYPDSEPTPHPCRGRRRNQFRPDHWDPRSTQWASPLRRADRGRAARPPIASPRAAQTLSCRPCRKSPARYRRRPQDRKKAARSLLAPSPDPEHHDPPDRTTRPSRSPLPEPVRAIHLGPEPVRASHPGPEPAPATRPGPAALRIPTRALPARWRTRRCGTHRGPDPPPVARNVPGPPFRRCHVRSDRSWRAYRRSRVRSPGGALPCRVGRRRCRVRLRFQDGALPCRSGRRRCRVRLWFQGGLPPCRSGRRRCHGRSDRSWCRIAVRAYRRSRVRSPGGAPPCRCCRSRPWFRAAVRSCRVARRRCQIRPRPGVERHGRRRAPRGRGVRPPGRRRRCSRGRNGAGRRPRRRRVPDGRRSRHR